MKASDVMDKEAFITEKVKKFKLVDIREQYVDLIAEAKIDKLGYENFLIKLLKAEEELIDELIRAKVNEARAKKGYEVKGDGASKEYSSLSNKNFK